MFFFCEVFGIEFLGLWGLNVSQLDIFQIEIKRYLITVLFVLVLAVGFLGRLVRARFFRFLCFGFDLTPAII